jgi:hypothetical protein
MHPTIDYRIPETKIWIFIRRKKDFFLLLFSLINVYLNHAYDIQAKEEEEVMMV